MKSITIHKLDDELEAVLVEKAQEEGLSQNQLIKQLLRKALGLNNTKNRRADFKAFFVSGRRKKLRNLLSAQPHLVRLTHKIGNE